MVSGSQSFPEDSPLFNRRIAFVGKLGGINRREARQIVSRLGGYMMDRPDATVHWIVVGADVIPMGEPEVLLEDWVTDGVREQEIDLIDETEFWRRIGVVEQEEQRQLYTPAMLAGLLEVPIAAIRRWHRKGLISPCRMVKRLPYFDFQQVALARRIADLVREGTKPETIEQRLVDLADRYPDLPQPLNQLSIVVEGDHVLVRQDDGLLEANGQRRLCFEASAHPGDANEATGTIAFPRSTSHESTIDSVFDEPVTQEDFLHLAYDLEDENRTSDAIEVYRSLLLAHGPTPDVCFRIAELLYQCNDLAAARERYSMAIELDPSFVEARANLGCVLVETGQLPLARATFEGALKHHQDYPDVHFHLARLLDDLHLNELATQHWDRFLELAPCSPWANEARDRLNLSASSTPNTATQRAMEQHERD